MDYHSIHGHDEANFSTPLTHRVLTVSAAEADAALLSQSSASSAASDTASSALRFFIPTGIETLDAFVAGIAPPALGDANDQTADEEARASQGMGAAAQREASLTPASAAETETGASSKSPRQLGGVRRGQLTEVWGPPGVGKTAIGLQLAANALCRGNSVVWIDCFQGVCHDRLADVVDHRCQGVDGAKDLEEGFVHYVCPSLPHFIAMLCPPPPAQPPCIPADTSLVVIDSLSALVNSALPRTVEGKGPPLMANGKKAPSPFDKRAQVLQCVAAALERMSETRNIAIVVLTQCSSRVQTERGAALAPALNGVAWDRGITTRLVLFRDWAWKDNRPVGGRFVGVQKLDGHESETGIDGMVAFDITETGVYEEHYTAVPPRSSTSVYKRKLVDAELDGRSADDDDFGWDNDDDDDLPSMPPQWQGSEDILLGQRRYEEEEEEEEEEDDDVIEVPPPAASREEEVPGIASGTDVQISAPGAPRSPRSIADSQDDSES
ncbi:hypothetical protein SCUCBS95973_006938 [Sporothrix curviconia]|uniref:RecA family profile 1 domain-containing protein n=1 Tax=Sporothrix curviconia TaxID=1260050 RepID=A0ABP0C9W5_9PEZI